MTAPQPAETVPEQYVLTLSCPDRQGIVHAVSSYLFMTGCNIEDSQQFGDHDTGLFFMRVHFSADAPVTVEKLRASFAAVGDSFRMEWQIHRSSERMRVVLMVSKFGHCLNDLLFRASIGALPVEIAAVVSNHTDFAELVASYDIPFRHIPVTRENKPEAEAQLLELVRTENVELVVLARYMQVLSDDLCKQLSGRIINIHHSFLPSFKGAKPYHQAHARGVKLIGATAHYVTADLDEGPIIEQEVERVGHGVTPDELVAIGRDVECQALARAVKWHAERRILLNGRRTVIFA
ncbi:formyltetrahydrofolate deformylase [Streptomyces sp. NPDC002917]|jgi:formyltetrahydrofolate deformylase|uniref:formyltetrahydrofolate deformylase n=1 Tax=unclassified Streptomyces TaxID=2593676 RepID=UPI002DDC7886|nr:MULTISPECIES: formyltetrahydrofolate deformylase [unclassified Streptomyces]WSF85216.1 formyltetrahydrofolate deformylase [Streptomyces sp. NBC_01744]WTC80381.1 formyltetrahydrofolate deformylase [Streptomyces sp. NBC_01653]WTD35074.1 formyltetrahydrofolate deformylase [Streptomyces sp. NBC_01643]WTD90486.1 formyltetrahydrofolate deformylase [Streptomyces sp. NBC_01637]WSC38493.1 formyltetrahydrofolate deformylase [Streptomyces sp. NBC_01763]